ncbi:MAG: hypothetical protein NC299_06360 [Lachnospiraceae bacterium]|nr:hypothetical protein [Ruminococcus sp.]MCM1274977.1 hypothetical protein [Lachnospiraceae bacterium]
MSLKSFDKFCEKMINNDPIDPIKDVFDERQTIVRAQLTTRALWAFAAMTGLNLLLMECGPQWCESYVLSTALLGAAAYLYWVIANARRGSLFGVNGTATLSSQIGFLFGDGIILPIAMLHGREPDDISEHFFFRGGMVSDYFAATLACALLITSGVVMAVSARNYKKRERSENENTP